jgi:transposase
MAGSFRPTASTFSFGHQSTKMADFELNLGIQTRTKLGKKKHLSEVKRTAILTARKAGVSCKKLAEQFDTTPVTISRTFTKFNATQSLKSAPRSGRPKKLTKAEIWYIAVFIKQNPRMTWKAVIANTPQSVHKSTIRRALGKAFQRKWRAIKRIQLTMDHAKAQLAHARSFRGKEQELVEVKAS